MSANIIDMTNDLKQFSDFVWKMKSARRMPQSTLADCDCLLQIETQTV